MGVPKFYRWISERYPKINQIVSDSALLPEFDHLYLDMNGIIHGCTHPSHLDVSDVLSERDMMLGIMHYLDRIITQIVKPKVSVYMAIDGVAPRAKLNQQRSRRFRSAKDMAEATKDLPKDEQDSKKGPAYFDSNCITPGTEFLAKVSDMIRYFIRQKLKEDPMWRDLTIIFSGHDIPGEGEHKIMQHIREMRQSPQYQANTRHCIYGQDADLIMLGLVTHEPHFTILREVIDFNFSFGTKNTLKQVKKFTKESDFQLLHLSVLREYLEMDFMYQQPQYDVERIIDDFVFMTFLVGNDFLPHMPTLDIGDGAFDLLFDLYKEQRVGWSAGQYLTLSGEISDASRLEAFLMVIGLEETRILEQKEKDEAAYVKKRRRWDKRDGKAEGPSDAELKAEEESKQNDYMSMIESLMANASLNDFVNGWQPVTEAGEKDFKGRYYFEKLKLTPVDKEAHWNLRKSYMEGLMWCLAYYYKGCISWGWFYPYHYGPMLSDLQNVPKMFGQINFDLGEPLTPFQQLMGCLPPASDQLVPPLYRFLMTAPDSPIIAFYPQAFAVDMNGKKNPWEGVNLLPFIDIALLKETVAKHCPDRKLSAAERKRNTVGNVYCYRFDVGCTDTVESPGKQIGLPDIIGSSTSVSVIEENHLPTESFAPKLLPGTQIPYPGFPSLNVLPIASIELIEIGLNCFGTPSKYPTFVLTLHTMPEMPPVEVLAENVLDKSLFVNWPMMHEGKVIAISTADKEVRLVNGKPKVKAHSQAQVDRWLTDAQAMTQMYHSGNAVPGSGGVQIGEVNIRLKLLPLQGMKTNPSNGATKKVFGIEEADVPLQLALWQAPAPDPRFFERGPVTLEERFREGAKVVLTKGKYRGCSGTVVGIADKKNVGVKVGTIPAEIPFGLAIARYVQDSYLSSSDAARSLKIHPGLLGKIAGRLQFTQQRYDLGLNLKTGDGMCVVGYTRKKVDSKPGGGKNAKPAAWGAGDSLQVIGSVRDAVEDDDERIQWEYSPKAVRAIQEYKQKYPQLFTALQRNPNEKRYDANAVFGPNEEAWLSIIREWLDQHETAALPRTPVSTEAMSYDAIVAVQKAADVRTLALKKRGFPKDALIKVPGSALVCEGSLRPTDLLQASDFNDNQAPTLGDRVVNLCVEGIPFGLRGTVVGIHEAASTGSVEVVMDEEFIGGTSLQGACANFRGKLCLWAHLLKISADTSKGVVDKLVPKNSGKHQVFMQKIMSKIDHDVNSDPNADSRDTKIEVPAPELTATTTKQPAVASAGPPAEDAAALPQDSRTPPRSTSRAGSNSRAGSSDRGAQAGWREARKPDKNGVGFKHRKSTKTGLERWKAVIAANMSRESALQLKSMLGVGVSKPLASAATNPPAVMAAGTSTSSAAQLKAMLGVGVALTGQHAAPHQSDAAAGLKTLLGVGSSSDAAPSPVRAAPAAAPATAADHLLQLMAKKAPPQPMGYPMTTTQPRSPFNFTYVEEGKQAPTPVVAPSGTFGMMPTPLPQTPPYMVGYDAPSGVAGFGMYQPVMGYPVVGSPPPAAPRGADGRRGSGHDNDHDFPPLGRTAPAPLNAAAAATPTSTTQVPVSMLFTPSSVRKTGTNRKNEL